MTTPAAVGAPRDRVDGAVKVTGRASFPADDRVDGVAYGALVLSRCARGRVVEIDDAQARRLAGVLDVMTWRDAPRLRDIGHDDDWLYDADRGEEWIPLQDDRIHYSGQIVAYVVAETLEVARHAAAIVRVVEEAEPVVASIAAGLPDAASPPTLYGEPLQVDRGHGAAALEQAPTSIEATYTTPSQHHQPIEPLVTVAEWHGDELLVRESTQWVKGARRVYADTLGIAQERVRVVSPFVGGGFGAKGRSWLHGALTAVAARRVERPVKLVLTRQQMFTLCGRRPATVQRVALGADGGGELVAVVHETTSETSRVNDFVEHAGKLTAELYASPNLALRQRVTALDLSSPTHTRAPGAAPGMFALESALDELAHELGIDPVALRRANDTALDPSSGRPWSSRHLDACYERGMAAIGWGQRRPTPGELADGDALIGYGMASACYPANRIGSNARAEMHADGSATILASTQDIGTGTATVLAQVAAERLGLPLERVHVRLGDSDLPRAPASYASLTVASVAPAVLDASDRLLFELTTLAERGELSPLHGHGEVAARDGALWAGGQRLGYGELLAAVGRESVGVDAMAQPDDGHHTHRHAAFGAVFAKVRVDRELGTVRLARLCGCFDTGRVLNRKTARSQLVGGMVWGVGIALTEDATVDERSGRFVTRNLADYRIPVNADVPPVEIEMLDIPDTNFNPVGAKGLGEVSVTGTPAAIGNAVFNATGIRVRDLPIGPEQLVGPLAGRAVG